MLDLAAFLAAQFDICETICNLLDPISLSALARTNTQLAKATEEFFAHPRLLLEDDQGDFSRLYDVISGHKTPAQIRPDLLPWLDSSHPKGQGNMRRITVINNACPRLVALRSRTEDGWHFSIFGAPGGAIAAQSLGLWQPLQEPMNPLLVPPQFAHHDFTCPEPDLENLDADVVEMYCGFVVGDWPSTNLHPLGKLFDQAVLAMDLKVLIFRSRRKTWLLDVERNRKVLLPPWVDQAGFDIRVENMAYQDGKLLLVGANERKFRRVARYKRLYSYDVKAYVRDWRRHGNEDAPVAFVKRVNETVALFKTHTDRSIASLLHPHVVPNVMQLPLEAQCALIRIIEAINAGPIVDSQAALHDLGRVPRLKAETRFELFPRAHLALLRSHACDRHYLVSTKGDHCSVLQARSFRDVGVHAHSFLPHEPACLAN